MCPPRSYAENGVDLMKLMVYNMSLCRAVSKNFLYFIFNEGRADQTNALLRSFCSQEKFLVRVQCSGEVVSYDVRVKIDQDINIVLLPSPPSKNDTAATNLLVPDIHTLKRSGECLFGFCLFLYEFMDNFTCLGLGFGLLGKLSL